MKFLRNTMCMLGLMASFIACSSTTEHDPYPVTPTVTFSNSTVTFAAEPTEGQSVKVTANVETTVSSDASWCRLNGTTAGKDFTFNIECDPNADSAPRECTIKATNQNKDQTYATLKVTQEGIAPAPEEENYPTPAGRPENGASPLALGWNLGNQMDAIVNGVADETGWGNPKVDNTLFEALAKAGFSSVRIPISWMGHFGAAPEYKIESAWLTRVAQLVNYAEKAGLKAIINIHHDGSPENWLSIKKASADAAYNEEVKATLRALWTQIAERFADKGDFLYFEGMNEIQDGGWGWGDNRNDGGKQYGIMNEWLQIFVDAVRSTGGENATRWLGIPTYTTNIDLGDYLVLPKDPANRLMVAVHCYEPYLYTLEDKYSDWGHTSKASEMKNGEKQLVAELDKITNKWISKGIPAYIGEFGCVRRSTERAEAFRKYYLEYLVKAAADRNIPVIYWDNGVFGSGRECSGLFNRTSGEYENDAADITFLFRKAWNNGDPAYTLQSVYDSAPN